jgi:hypothetical protein
MRFAALLLLLTAPLAAQRPTYQQQMQDNQRRLESIRRDRSEVEQELERLRTQAHSLSDEIANIEQQKQSTIASSTNWTKITGLGDRQITVDLLIAQDALLEKGAVLERRLVDIYKGRGRCTAGGCCSPRERRPAVSLQYLYLVSRRDRLLSASAKRVIASRQRQLWSMRGARRARRRVSAPWAVTSHSRGGGRPARDTPPEPRRLSRLDRTKSAQRSDQKRSERARRRSRVHEASGAGAITTARPRRARPGPSRRSSIRSATTGPNNTRIPRHGIGIRGARRDGGAHRRRRHGEPHRTARALSNLDAITTTAAATPSTGT